MLRNGYLVHPDIWMLWFSFFVAVAVVLRAAWKVIRYLTRQKRWLVPVEMREYEP